MLDLLKFYQKLPYPLKVLAASMRGYQLRWWRYSKQTDQLVRKALEKENWSSDQWKLWQENRLEYILNRAINHVPYYQKQWSERRRKGDKSSANDLRNWPILSKESLRKNPRAFLADDVNPSRMFTEHTSGTTGTPITLWWSHDTVKRWYGLFEARVRYWNDVSRSDRWAILGGQLVTPIHRKKPPFWVWNKGLNQLYLSSYHINSSNVIYYFDAIEKYKINYIFGYPSSLESLAVFAKENKLEFQYPIKVAICNAEPLFEDQRRVIGDVFKCKVRSTYGMAEIVTSASECEFEKMHLWPEVGIVEIQKKNSDLDYFDKFGTLIATGLFNPDMPLIRLNTGDSLTLENHNAICKCGRKLPVISKIHGRNDDIIITPSGRRIGRLDPIFKANFPILEAQIIQEDLSTIRVLYVPAAEFSVRHEENLRSSIQVRVGADMNIILTQVSQISRGPSGKFRAVISHVTHSELK